MPHQLLDPSHTHEHTNHQRIFVGGEKHIVRIGLLKMMHLLLVGLGTYGDTRLRWRLVVLECLQQRCRIWCWRTHVQHRSGKCRWGCGNVFEDYRLGITHKPHTNPAANDSQRSCGKDLKQIPSVQLPCHVLKNRQ